MSQIDKDALLKLSRAISELTFNQMIEFSAGVMAARYVYQEETQSAFYRDDPNCWAHMFAIWAERYPSLEEPTSDDNAR